VLPVEPPLRNFAWAWRLAQDFARLQGTLAEAGLSLADVPARAGDDFPETERWRQIAGLERQHAAKLAGRGRRDAQAVKLEQARAPVLPPGITRIVLLATPDPSSLALEALAAHARSVPVAAVVFAPASEAAAFDTWGRPLTEVWAGRELVLPGFGSHVHLCADPGAQADRIVALAGGYGPAEGMLGVGVADPEVMALLETRLRHAGLAGFNPEGRSRQGDGLAQLLGALAGLAREDSFAAVTTLARCPDFLGYVGGLAGERFSAARFLQQLDELHTRHLPPDLHEAQRHRPDSVELAAIGRLRATLTAGQFPANAAAALREIFAERRLDLAQPADARLAASIEAWADVMRETQALAAGFPEVTTGDWWDVALRIYGESKVTDDRPAGAVELLGWLELLWEDAPHLAVTGLNDGGVPEAVVGDPFLPESLRVRLHLKTNAARLARDAYLLQALAAGRARAGRLDLLLGKTSAAGDPLRPSRLLLHCADADLPERVKFLFQAVAVARPSLPWRRAWLLQPGWTPAPGRLAVTALRAWLDCPFRFYLSRVRRMSAVDTAKTELDAMDFGTLCHAALEAMGREEALRDCTDEAVLREFLLARLEAEARRRFGVELTLPLVMQVESARQRLAAAAAVQAQTRAEGWVIEAVERKFQLEIGGLTISGQIDRIDRHEVTGEIRVLDYKTSDQAARPESAHLRKARRDEPAPEFARCSPDGEQIMVWSDLQLPLYLRALAADHPGPVSCAYFNLPKAVGETGIVRWDDYTPALAEAAWHCAEGVAAAIRAGEFWPPNENMDERYDDFAALFHHGVAASVDGEGAR
jgi:ATP-dependent helicase/nuclease subunit B